MADEITDRIDTTAAAGIKKVRNDEGEVEALGIDELIKADRYTKEKDAMTANGYFGLRHAKLQAPGAG